MANKKPFLSTVTNKKPSKQASAFICYCHDDKDFVRRLAKDLREYGVKVWLDEAELSIGDNLVARISNAISEMDYLLAILSSKSVESNWVKYELAMAMEKELKDGCVKVLPVLSERCEIPTYLSDKLYIDFTDQSTYVARLLSLLETLGSGVIYPFKNKAKAISFLRIDTANQDEQTHIAKEINALENVTEVGSSLGWSDLIVIQEITDFIQVSRLHGALESLPVTALQSMIYFPYDFSKNKRTGEPLSPRSAIDK